MEKLAKYRQIVRELLIAHATPNDPNIECQLIFDTEHDHYQILDIGWQELNRIYACYIHLDIRPLSELLLCYSRGLAFLNC